MIVKGVIINLDKVTVREFWQHFVLILSLNTAVKKLVFLPQLFILFLFLE